jgi:transcriptional regulator with XRE-family HTH domain
MAEIARDGAEFGRRRRAAGIAGHVVCGRARLSRAKLSAFERGYVRLSPEELCGVQNALDALVEAKHKLAALAAECGWPVSAL